MVPPTSERHAYMSDVAELTRARTAEQDEYCEKEIERGRGAVVFFCFFFAWGVRFLGCYFGAYY